MATTIIDNCSVLKSNDCTAICKARKSETCITCRNLPDNKFECICPEGYEGDARRNGTGCMMIGGDNNGTTKLIIIGVGSVVGILLISLLIILVYKRLKRRRNDIRRSLSVFLEFGQFPDFFEYNYLELSDATNNFDDHKILGTGGQGVVYEGVIRGCRVAVKRCRLGKDNYKDFLNETYLLAKVRHDNVVRVLGYCIHSGFGFIVYEFVSNGTLHERLHVEVNKPMQWETRIKIALGVAEGIRYLHYGSSKAILHRDVKTTNILLDDRCNAKLADFGISREMAEGATHVDTDVKGTPAYVPPEYQRSAEQRLTGDIFSFGIVLAEILTRKRSLFEDEKTGQRRFLHEYVRSLDRENMMKALDKDMIYEDFHSRDNMMLALDLAQNCCAISACARPTMTEVVEKLSKMRLRDEYLTASEQSPASTSYVTIEIAESEFTSDVTERMN